MIYKIIAILKRLFLAISAGIAIGFANEYYKETGTKVESRERR